MVRNPAEEGRSLLTHRQATAPALRTVHDFTVASVQPCDLAKSKVRSEAVLTSATAFSSPDATAVYETQSGSALPVSPDSGSTVRGACSPVDVRPLSSHLGLRSAKSGKPPMF